MYLQVILSLKGLGADVALVFPLIAVGQFMLGQGTRIVKVFLTLRALQRAPDLPGGQLPLLKLGLGGLHLPFQCSTNCQTLLVVFV